MSKRGHLPLLGALMALVPITIDAYLPSLPNIEHDFSTSTTLVQFTVLACLLGSATGQLFVGSISDTIGRKPTLMYGLSLFIIISIFAAIAPNIWIYLVLRYLQGVTSSVGTVLSRAVVRDLLDGTSAARAYSALMMVMGVAPILSPLLGSALLTVSSWRSIMIFLACYGLGMMILIALTLPETLPESRRIPANRKAKREARSLIFRDPLFIMAVIGAGFGNGMLLVYLSTSSFAFQNTFKISPQLYSIFFAVNAIGIVLITQVNRRLLLRYSPANLLRFGCGWGAFWTTCLVIYSHLPNPNLYVTAGLLVFVMSVIGFVLANGITLATYHHADRAGTASGYFGAGQTFIGSIFGITSNLLGASMRAMSIELVIPMLLAAAIVIPLLPRYQPKSR